MLVDPVLALLRLARRVAGAIDRPRALVERDDVTAAARDARHLTHHASEVERVMERRDAVGHVERAVRERAGSRRPPARGGTGRRPARRTRRDRARCSGRRGCPCRRRCNPAAMTCRAPQHFAAPTSSTRIPGSSSPSSRSNECSFAFHVRSSQPQSRVRYGSAASTASSGSYQPWSRAIAAQPSASRAFSVTPGAVSSSSRGMPSATGYDRPQPRQLERLVPVERPVAGRAAQELDAGRRGRDDAHGSPVSPRVAASSACSRSTCSWRSSIRRRVAALNERWS